MWYELSIQPTFVRYHKKNSIDHDVVMTCVDSIRWVCSCDIAYFFYFCLNNVGFAFLQLPLVSTVQQSKKCMYLIIGINPSDN